MPFLYLGLGLVLGIIVGGVGLYFYLNTTGKKIVTQARVYLQEPLESRFGTDYWLNN